MSKLSEILDDIGFWDERSEIERAHKKQTEQALLAWVDEVIGNNETRKQTEKISDDAHRIRNQLRAEIRKRARQ